MNVEYHPLTASELNAARKYYNELTVGLGDNFRAEVLSKIESLAKNPLIYEEVRGVRRALLKRFPYSILYRTPASGVVRVLAIRHHSRHPAYGAGRD